MVGIADGGGETPNYTTTPKTIPTPFNPNTDYSGSHIQLLINSQKTNAIVLYTFE
jgi:hypothetical protein